MIPEKYPGQFRRAEYGPYDSKKEECSKYLMDGS
jgi:hypothetical protein